MLLGVLPVVRGVASCQGCCQLLGVLRVVRGVASS